MPLGPYAARKIAESFVKFCNEVDFKILSRFIEIKKKNDCSDETLKLSFLLEDFNWEWEVELEERLVSSYSKVGWENVKIRCEKNNSLPDSYYLDLDLDQ